MLKKRKNTKPFDLVFQVGAPYSDCYNEVVNHVRAGPLVETKKRDWKTNLFFLVRRAGLEPARCNHTPLKRTRLPVPPSSRNSDIIEHNKNGVNFF